MRFSSTRHHRPPLGLAFHATAMALLLAACGGGGGGSGDAATAVQPLSLTATNAKPASADALDSVETEPASGSAAVVDGLKSMRVGPSVTLLSTAQALSRLVPATGTPGLKGAINATEPCPYGGTLSAVGSTASNTGGFTAGDNLALTANNCIADVSGSRATINGALTFSVASGSVGSTYPFSVVLGFTATNFQVTANGETAATTGDQRLAWTATSASVQTLQVTGTAFAISLTSSTRSKSMVWRNYEHVAALDGTVRTSRLSTQVETTNSRLGTTAVSYQLSTPTPVVSSTTTGDISSGSVLLAGNRSSALVTVTGVNTFKIEVDTNGDSTYDQTLTATRAELEGLF